MVRVEEMSKYPTYLAIKLLYQGGQTEIASMEIAKVMPKQNHTTNTIWVLFIVEFENVL